MRTFHVANLIPRLSIFWSPYVFHANWLNTGNNYLKLTFYISFPSKAEFYGIEANKMHFPTILLIKNRIIDIHLITLMQTKVIAYLLDDLHISLQQPI